jgi:hypothetical protein
VGLDGPSGPSMSLGEQEDYLRRLKDHINIVFERDTDDTDNLLDIPDDYVALLRFCNGVYNPDLRYLSLPGIHGTDCLSPAPLYCKSFRDHHTQKQTKELIPLLFVSRARPGQESMANH